MLKRYTASPCGAAEKSPSLASSAILPAAVVNAGLSKGGKITSHVFEEAFFLKYLVIHLLE